MWLFSKSGFVSVVAHREHEGMLLVRSRFEEDIAAVCERLAAAGVMVEPFEDRHADYRYRVVCPREAFATMVASLVGEIDYDNFKSAVHGDPVRDRAYMGCWSAMNQAQHAK
ncbi:MAG: hypothetical protein HN700_17205 [Verrucomicrobia bacterium]|jgi:hypothetical protein|nr:hypothetical protein [Verrucomicrobiota bacterium]